ncbi:MAG: ABC transporter ATP-binding protein [Leucothrix sp.]
MSLLTLEKVGLAYQSQTVVDDVSLSLEDGEIACLLGPSGCGKTTLLRAIAGFKSLNSGTIESAGKILSSKTQVVPPEKRRIGMVFQDFALFPHLTVGDNICFGIRQQQRVEKRQRLQALLALIGLESSEHKYPHELSGGQQQRVALARAIAPKPHLLLLDEPFSSMDVELRDSLAKEVRGILKQEKVTAIMVTHDQHEAFSMADRIGVLNEGKLLQWGTAEQLYHAPNSDFIAHFVGFSDFLTGKVNGSQVETALGCFPYRPVDNGLLADLEGQSVKVLIRPEYIQIAEDSRITAKLVSRAFRGGYYRYLLRLQGGEEIQALLPSLANYQLGDVVTIAVSIDRVSIFKNG